MPVRPWSVSVVTVGVLLPLLAGCAGLLSPSVAAVSALPEDLVAPVDLASAAPAAPPGVSTPTPTPVLATSAPTPVSARPVGAPPDLDLARRRLTEQRYYGGAPTGASSAALRSAVMAFQKVNGLTVDGVVGPRTAAALAAPRTPVLRYPGPADRIEVDLTRQVLYVVKAGRLLRILPVSSGDGQSYIQRDGQVARALTPVGQYRITRRLAGPERAFLGTLYDPQYFYRGWAIHGSDSVPAGPASHGCVRITRWDATWLFGQLSVGWSVSVYGGRFTFPAGSQAAGTDAPTGDTPNQS